MTIEEYISNIKEFYNREGCGSLDKVFYRGQSNENYKLIPSLVHKLEGYLCEEENYILFEKEILHRAKLEYLDWFLENNNRIDELALMQHYGLPTRLMDVTENPLVALYFACIGNEEMDGEVFIFNSGMNAGIYTSYESKIIQKNNKIAFVRAKIFSDRQRAQQGLYMWFPDKKLKGLKKNNRIVSKIIKISANDKKSLLCELKMIGISSKSLFPDNKDICCKEILNDITKDVYSC